MSMGVCSDVKCHLLGKRAGVKYYHKSNDLRKLTNKLLLCLVLGTLLFASGCKQFKNTHEEAIPPTDHVTLTIKADSGYIFRDSKQPCMIEVEKGSTQAGIKTRAKEKIKLKQGYEVIGWKIGDKNGINIEDRTIFNEEQTLYAVSKKKSEREELKKVTYKVEHHQQALDGTYVKIEIEEKEGEK